MNEKATKDKNYYELLEVSPSASMKEIQKKYGLVKNTYSQESAALYSLMGPDECSKMIEKIEEAFSILSDPTKRKKYDLAQGIDSNWGPTANEPTALEENQTAAPSDKNGKNPSRNISRLIASRRFNLDYKIDPEMEKRIETETHFTGSFLKEIRNYKNVDIKRMSDMTKISKTYLRSIEEENVDNLPAIVYVRGFVYQYAKCLKLNPDMVASSYVAQLKEHDGQ